MHHLRHWEDGGTTDTENLLALCAHHHRLHHRGGLGMAGNADDPDGIVFTDERDDPSPPVNDPRLRRARWRPPSPSSTCPWARGPIPRASASTPGRWGSTSGRWQGERLDPAAPRSAQT
ncbi:MAG: HNH endonuclease [Acidimicrobiales bacterium]